MGKRFVTEQEVTAAITAAVAEKGEDYVYPGFQSQCEYVRGGAPSCIVGHVFAAFLTPEEFNNFAHEERLRIAKGLDTDVHSMLDFLPVEFGSRTTAALSGAQRDQDQGETWGCALNRFNHVLEVTAEEEEDY